jgi:phosphatidylglycerol lysyltransferase
MPFPSSDLLAQAREIVLRHGYNCTAYQILNPGLHYFFSKRHDAVTAYMPRAGAWVVAGAPVCAEADLPAIVEELESAAAAAGCSVCYVCAAQRLKRLLRSSSNHSTITLGAQPVWNPAGWTDLVSKQSSIRSQLNRARNKGVVIHEHPADSARADNALQEVLRHWLAHRPIPPMHFLTEPDTFSGLLHDRLLFVATRHDQPVAFLLASPVPTRNGYLFEQLARSPHAPNGTAELLIDAAMRAVASRGHELVSLGLVPLTTHAPLQTNPLWLRPLFAWARAHGRRFYHFDGLENFRAKLHPDRWEPVYTIVNRPAFTPRALYAASAAMLADNPFAFFARALARAVKQEFRQLLLNPRAAT